MSCPIPVEEIRAMDRRRFIPSPEGLEGRALLSTTTPASSLFGQPSAINTPNQTQDLPETFKLKVQRIDHLPFFIRQLQLGRFIPAGIISQLQTDLLDIAARLHPASPAVLNAFNLQLRDTLPRASLTQSDAHGLNHRFGQVLSSAGATPQAVASLQNDMNNLARVDANSPNPVFLATNDYALVIQTALAVGRPIMTPNPPLLAHRDGVQLPGGGVTGNHQPKLVGNYQPGATVDAGTQMQIIDAEGNILGVGDVQSNGKYAVTISEPLSDGKYILHARARDAQGHLSNPSLRFVLKVVTKPQSKFAQENLTPPQGPLGLR